MPNPEREYLPIPQVLEPAERICFCITIPRDSEHLAAFWGAIGALGQRYTWGKPLTADSETVAQFWQGILDENRGCYEEVLFMANGGCGCCPDAVYRFTADGIKQVSRDGGVTWETDLTDPRNNGSILPPPPWLLLPGGHECEGATTAANNLHALMDEILSTGATGLQTFYEVIASIICVFSVGTACVAAELIAALAVIITELTETYIDSVLTDEVYEAVLCFMYCHIEPDATFTEAGWQAVKSDLNESTINADAKFVLWQVINALGSSGLTNMARLSVGVTANCDDCICEPCENLFPTLGTEVGHPDTFTWELESADDGFGQQVIIVQFGSGGLSECCCIENVEIAGFAPFEFYRACGDPDQTAGNPGANPIWEYRRGTGVGGAAFGMTITVSNCEA